MSELIQKNDNRATIRWKLLTGVSALALTVYVSSTALAKAEDADHPQIWIELGGQLAMEHGLSDAFTAPFMSTPSATYPKDVFSKGLKQPLYALGEDGKITFQPENSNWIFSASIQYGRSSRNSHVHDQGPEASGPGYSHGVFLQSLDLHAAPFADIKARPDERHEILDFSAGKEVGLGVWGHDGSSNINLGVRLAQFTAKSTVSIFARPNVAVKELEYGLTYILRPFPTFHQYTMAADAAQSFKGVGPSLSWNASAALAGNKQDGEIVLDWGIDASVLFGRQKAKTSHSTKAHQLVNSDTYVLFYGISYPRHHSGYPQLYNHLTHQVPTIRSRNVTVPNIGGFAGLSVKYPNVKFSMGYRYDTFIGAMDTGIDARKTSDMTFQGPYASISIGIGD